MMHAMHWIKDITHIYFLGIGGIGMSALARYFHQRGVSVSGYDKVAGTITHALQEEGIMVSHSDDPAALPVKPQLVVHTPAVPKETRLYRHFLEQDIPILKRARVLGALSEETPCIAVAGTHGKTTICAMLTHILMTAGVPCMAFLGGISKNYNTNYLGDPSARWLIAEADEFDRSFLSLSPKIALVSSMDADHLDVYGDRKALMESFSAFAGRLPDDGTLITQYDIREEIRFEGRQHTYHTGRQADYSLEKLQLSGGLYRADFRGMLSMEDVRIGQPGLHNVENAMAAAALAHQAGVGGKEIRQALASFSGVKRRFELCLQAGDTVYVDDYAHHPEEIRACISSARQLWPGKKLTVVFQPHLYSRTRDLAVQFAESLSLADEIILMDIYAAREKPMEGVDTGMLLSMISHPRARHCGREELMRHLGEASIEVLITMGAGDIDMLSAPITELLKNKALS